MSTNCATPSIRGSLPKIDLVPHSCAAALPDQLSSTTGPKHAPASRRRFERPAGIRHQLYNERSLVPSRLTEAAIPLDIDITPGVNGRRVFVKRSYRGRSSVPGGRSIFFSSETWISSSWIIRRAYSSSITLRPCTNSSSFR